MKKKNRKLPKMPKAVRYVAEGSDLGEMLLNHSIINSHAKELENRAAMLRSISNKLLELYHRLRNNKAR